MQSSRKYNTATAAVKVKAKASPAKEKARAKAKVKVKARAKAKASPASPAPEKAKKPEIRKATRIPTLQAEVTTPTATRFTTGKPITAGNTTADATVPATV